MNYHTLKEALDYSNRLITLLHDSDPRVIKSVIASLANLPTETVIPVLDQILGNYQPEYNEVLTRLFVKTNDPRLFRGLEKWLEKTESEQEQLNILRIAAGMPSKKIRAWCKNKLENKSGRKVEFINWLNQTT